MKKKLLSLVLAGAMVASTSVSAFATTPTATTTEKKTILENEDEKDVNVTVKGDILDDKGNAQQGTISVTVPTAVNFTVTKDGRLASGDMVITNHSSEKLKVSVKQFSDANAASNINVVKKSEFASGSSSVPREQIWLSLVGNGVSVGFESEGSGKMYNLANENEAISTKKEVGKIDGSGELRLNLEGGGGTGASSNSSSAPIQDNFNLVLTIERDRA